MKTWIAVKQRGGEEQTILETESDFLLPKVASRPTAAEAVAIALSYCLPQKSSASPRVSIILLTYMARTNTVVLPTRSRCAVCNQVHQINTHKNCSWNAMEEGINTRFLTTAHIKKHAPQITKAGKTRRSRQDRESPSIHPLVCLAVCLPVRPIDRSVRQSVCLSVCLPACLPAAAVVL